jgi:flagellar assembly protein FliH
LSTDPTPTAKAMPAENAPMRKFMFDRSFDDVAIAQRAIERKPVLMKPEQIDAMKKESHDSGFTAGQKAGNEEQLAHVAAIMATVAKNVDALMKNLDALSHEQAVHTRQLVMAIAKKIMPEFTARNGLQEIEVLIDKAVHDMAREPRLVVRVNEAQLDAVNEKIQTITTQRAYSGQVIVLADAGVAAGDCRIEWADGGIERNTQATWDAIETTVLPPT